MATDELEPTLTDLMRQMSELTKALNDITNPVKTPFVLRATESSDEILVNPSGTPPLPDPRLIRRVIRARKLRAKHFDGELFADPAWDILLDLAASQVECIRVSVTSLCIASGVPSTTALRWIGQMVEMGLLERVEDEEDRRRAFITLTDKAVRSISQYFAEACSDPKSLF